ncbi:MAG TPA: pyroglutamyl-peptidase I [Candidatus Korarchaeota archaeon]|nr:pyroglutamyl-peptidase I [Candidatus Korarchaeota archaeon]
MKVLLTGFEAWGDVPENPTKGLVEWANYPGLVKLVLPVSYRRAADLLRSAIREKRPDVVVSLGLSPGSPVIRVETVALNVAHSREPDVDGYKPQFERIDPEGPAAYFTTLPAEKVVSALRQAGIPARLSFHAGTFICNLVSYVALREIDLLGLNSIAGFIHVPYSSEIVAKKLEKDAASLPKDILQRVLATILEIAVEAAQFGGER